MAKIEAVILDLDGVITKTAKLHALAWQEMFNEFLKAYNSKHHKNLPLFDIESDYPRYIDGIPRYDGVRNFLRSRSIKLPEGDPDDDSGQETICGLGNRKNLIFQGLIKEKGVEVYEDTVMRVHEWKDAGLEVGVISSSKNCKPILESSNLLHLFDTLVDGVISAEQNIQGKPEPDIFLKAAENLGVSPSRAAIVEDAISGVRAGRKGGFHLVIGVNRAGIGEELKKNGADIVVESLSDNKIDKMISKSGKSADLANALKRKEEVFTKVQSKKLAVFLDYDGTLTPIASRPQEAVLKEDMRQIVKELAEVCTTGIISGRDRENVKKMVGLDQLVYAGSHGFDISGPGFKMQHEKGKECKPVFDQAEKVLKEKLKEFEGVEVEKKLFAIAIHYRHLAQEKVERFIEVVKGISVNYPELKQAPGKMIIELKPDVDWHKGKALFWLIENLKLENIFPIYIGDDMTDEDAFGAIKGKGLGILVGHHGEPTYADYVLEDQDEVKAFLKELIVFEKKSMHERMEN